MPLGSVREVCVCGGSCSSELRKEHVASHEPISLHSGSTHLDTIHPGSVAIDMTTVAMATLFSMLRTRSCSSPQSWRVWEWEMGKDQRTGGIKRSRGGRPEQAGLGRKGGENVGGVSLIRGCWREATLVISPPCLHQTSFLQRCLDRVGG